MPTDIFLGNEAIAWGLVESGCRVATGYPGTPSSEILAGVIRFKERLRQPLHAEWSTNEKVAFEIALAASWTGVRAATTMKQVGLNVATDPLYSAAYTGVKGGFVVVVADDPGLHSSQTEQDSRLTAMNARVPVFDPSSPAEARQMVGVAFDFSERFGLPVILRPTTRLCHAVQSLTVPDELPAAPPLPKSGFRRDASRWAATPKFRVSLLRDLTGKLQEVAAGFETSGLNYVVNETPANHRFGVIASGVAFHTAQDVLAQLGVSVPLLKIGTPYPLPAGIVRDFLAGVENVLVLEEPDACIELQLPRRDGVLGRLNGVVRPGSELAPDIVAELLAEQLQRFGHRVTPLPSSQELQEAVNSVRVPVRRPRLCPGCGHRSAFFAVRMEFGSRAIYPGDIGCYTLGVNLRAMDTVVDMGASVAMANGFYQANRLLGDERPIVAAIGDSTFFHSGIPPLINAVHTGARFVLLILDNHVTAMTGFQPTPDSRSWGDGHAELAVQVPIPDLVRACGVGFVAGADPYDHQEFRQTLRRAYEYSQSPEGGVAVIVVNRPCVLYDPSPVQEAPLPVIITEDCDGCRYCVEAFECPALVLRADGSRVDIDEKICIDCGQCVDACYKGFIQWKPVI